MDAARAETERQGQAGVRVYQGASGAAPVDVRQSLRRQSGVLGPLHRGFGFRPEKIVQRSKEIARERADEAERKKVKARQQSLLLTPETAQSSARLAAASAPPASALPTFSQVEDALSRLQLSGVPKKPAAAANVFRSRPVVSTENRVSDEQNLSLAAKRSGRPPVGQVREQRSDISARDLHPLGMGMKPSRAAVFSAAFVDMAVAFALLALVNLGVYLDNWSERTEPLRATLNLYLGSLFRMVDLPSTGISTAGWHGVVLVGVWAGALYLIQCLSQSFFGCSFGRRLAGISVNRVASRGSGLFKLPFVEIVTFGGLFILPFLLKRPDRHPLLGSLRFHVDVERG